MNKRKAAEDFYFMEKLAKINKVETISKACVYPSGRGSWRVPFGTGQRVNRFLEGLHNEYTLYSLNSFFVLRDWLDVFMDEKAGSAKEYLDEAKKINTGLFDFLKLNQFEKIWDKIITNSQSVRQIQNQKKIWFDGFRTLKLIHYLRDNDLPNEPMFSVLDEFFLYKKQTANLQNDTVKLPSLNIQLKYLEYFRKHS